MTYELILTGKFKNSLKLARKRGLDISLLEDIVTKLQNNIPLEDMLFGHQIIQFLCLCMGAKNLCVTYRAGFCILR